MSTRQATNGLMAFLLWNMLLNAFSNRTKDSILHLRATWLAARERYEALQTSFERTGFSGFGFPQTNISNASIFGTILTAVLAIFLVAALIAPVANLTTGVTIAHTGFTPNPNITGTPGLVPITQLFPLVFAFLGIAIAAHYFREQSAGL